jgi:hypothetical protein
MPTLVNYNQATFTNHVKPNKRRLQELQHSEARAHAARVAYWRKKGISPDEAKQRGKRSSDEAAGDCKSSSSASTKIKQESDQPIRFPTLPDDSIAEHEHRDLTSGSGSESLRATPHSNLSSSKSSFRLKPKNATSHDDRQSDAQDDRMRLPTLNRTPTSQLFDPLDSTPIRQEAEVVAAMDHCR